MIAGGAESLYGRGGQDCARLFGTEIFCCHHNFRNNSNIVLNHDDDGDLFLDSRKMLEIINFIHLEYFCRPGRIKHWKSGSGSSYIPRASQGTV